MFYCHTWAQLGIIENLAEFWKKISINLKFLGQKGVAIDETKFFTTFILRT